MKNITMRKSVAMAAIALAMAGCDTDELPDKNGNSFGQLTVSGDARVGETLTATVADANGVDESAINYSWMADGTVIPEATSNSFTLTEAQAGSQISVTVSYIDNDDYQERITSNETSSALMNFIGSITISGAMEVGKLLTATLLDDNNFDLENVVFTWYADGVEISGETAATYVIMEADVGKVITVTASYVDGDAYDEVTTSEPTSAIIANQGNVPATFENLAATVANNAMNPISGNVAISDDDAGEDMAEVQTDVMTTYGTFSIADNGDWTYTLDTANATVSSLASSTDTITDDITIMSTDGSTAVLVITITGTDMVAATQVAKITDSMTDDAGELRYKLDSAISQGKLTVSFLKENNSTNPDGAKDAYIGLFGESTSTSNAIVDLRIQEDKFVIRDQDIDVAIPFVPGVWTDVEMTWDASAATDAIAPLVTITINGTSVTTDAFSSASSSLSDVMAGVRYAIFKLGDNSSTIVDAAYYVDDVKIYSDMAGTTVAFEDDFEGYTVGDSLDDDNGASPYHSNTAEAVVALYGTDTGPTTGPGSAGNQIAQITDSMTDDAGELRYKLDSAIAQGKLTVSFLKQDNSTNPDGAKDAYIGLFGESTSTSNAIVDLRIQEDKFVIRDQDIDVAIPFVPGVWTDVEITWDASAATDAVAPLVTITINGTSVTTDAFSSASSSLSDVMTGVRYAIFKLGDNGSTVVDAAYFVDEVKIYSDMAGTTVAFEDDFESYTDGVSLDPDSNDASVYHSNSAEVIVTTE
ncbi:hypothetical protein E2K93_04490 [Thalassotalea sp. HSM 43]|uniref:VCBS domain-containing protein n=1 Tax=Thalassotalea sp. HSM 43 TaxID=2552945 RepID=UPI0010812B86|nr:VCBS domain-containing protein [Thalassotalea sp. HSM 43]QBY03683.1 hypothetical protein E2K93_04490 [Thalassotalea sp. HSM 43]